MQTKNLATAPTTANKTETALTAATATASIATGVGDGSDCVLNVAVSQAFNIAFSADGTNTVTNPADASAFPAGLYRFRLCSKNSHYKITAVANGFAASWKDRA